MIAVESKFDSKNNTYGKLSIEVRTKEGIVRKAFTQTVDSFVAGFWNYFQGCLNYQGTNSGVLLDGSAATIQPLAGAWYPFKANGGIGSRAGIQVGAGNTAVALDDYSLASEITHGTGAGQLSYAANVISSDQSNRRITIGRTFTNNSGSTITVEEAGFVGYGDSFSSTALLLLRDVISPSIALANGEELSITYTLEFAYGTRNVWGFFNGLANDPDFITIYEVSGTANYEYPAFSVAEKDAGVQGGLMLGTGGAAVSVTDTSLDSIILPGSGAGRLDCSATVVTSLQKDVGAGTVSFTLERTFTNNSGSDITTREVGLFCSNSTTTYNASTTNLLDRRLFASPITIAAGESRGVKWKFTYSL